MPIDPRFLRIGRLATLPSLILARIASGGIAWARLVFAGLFSIALASAGAASMGCSSCDRGARVPFKRQSAPASQAPDSKLQTDAAHSGAPEPGVPFEPQTGQHFPEGKGELEIDGVTLELAEGAFRAALALDLDQDEDRDALVLATDADGVPALQFAAQQEGEFGPLQVLGTEGPGLAGCRLLAGDIRTIAPIYAVARLDLTCGEESEPDAEKPESETEKPEPETEKPTEKRFWVIALQETPHLVGQFAALPPPPGLAPGTLGLELSAEDLDQDGHADIVTKVTVAFPQSDKSETLALHWLNRPGGLARDRSQPEELLSSLANRARRLTKRDPDAGLAMVERVRALHAALCLEGGAARLRIGARNGLTCGRSTAAGRAETVACEALVAKGEVVAAIEASAKLDQAAYWVTPWDRKLAQKALDSIPEVTGLTWVEGPEHRPAARPELRLAALGFVDENRLLLRGAVPMSYDLSQRSLAPLDPAAGSSSIVDPSGRLAAVGIRRACDGFRLRIVSASQLVAGLPTRRTVAEPLIQALSTPAGASCPEPHTEPDDDDSGLRVLGWTARGIVLAHGEQLRVVVFDPQAPERAIARALKPGQDPPGPLPPGVSTRDGRFFALVTPLGVAIRRVFPSPSTSLVRFKEGWGYQEVTDVAVSPSGRRIAVVRKGRVHIAM